MTSSYSNGPLEYLKDLFSPHKKSKFLNKLGQFNMLKIIGEALPNRTIITILFGYIYFYQHRFSRNFNLPQGGTCKDLKSSSNRKLSGVPGVLSMMRDEPRVIVPCGDIELCYSGCLQPTRRGLRDSFQFTLPIRPVQHFKTLQTVWSLHIH